jgi:hypothetical protein
VAEIHQKANGVSANATTKAMKKLFCLAYREAGGFFRMKWAAGNIVVSRFF